LASGQPSGWFIYRPPFNGFDDPRKVVEWLKGLKGMPYICVFPGSLEHWYWSLRYSLERSPATPCGATTLKGPNKGGHGALGILNRARQRGSQAHSSGLWRR